MKTVRIVQEYISLSHYHTLSLSLLLFLYLILSHISLNFWKQNIHHAFLLQKIPLKQY